MAAKDSAANNGDAKIASNVSPPPPPPPDIKDPPEICEVLPCSVRLSWPGPADKDEMNCTFVLQQCRLARQTTGSSRNNAAKTIEAYSGPEKGYIAKDLSPGHSYTFRVQAIRNSVKGSFGPHVSVETPCVAPTVPRQIQQTGKKKNTISIKWNAPSSDGGTPIIEYQLLWDKGNADLDVADFDILGTVIERKFKMSSLEPGRRYRVQVKSTNAIGSSPFSSPSFVESAAGAPEAPLPPALKSSTVSSLHIVWAAANGNGAPISEYTLEMHHSKYGFRPIYNGPEREYVVEKLDRVTSYEFRVAAKNVAGISRFSDKASFETRASIPGPATKPTIKNTTQSEIQLICKIGSDDGGSEVNGFVVEISQGMCATQRKFPANLPFHQVYSGTDPSLNLRKLKPGTAYQCRIACYNKVGTGPFSEIARISTKPIPPGKPDPPIVTLGKRASSTTIGVSWSPPGPGSLGGAKVIRYVLQSSPAPLLGHTIDPDSWVQLYDGDMTQFLLTGLDPAQKYLFRVAAGNLAGLGPPSQPAEAVTSAAPPAPPDAATFKCKTINSTSVSLVWQQAGDNGALVSSYLANLYKYSGGSTPLSTINSNSTNATFSDLEPVTEYQVQIKASNAMGSSPFSSKFTFKTLAGSPGEPKPPKLVSVGKESAKISWTPPTTNGSPIKYYTLQINGEAIRLPQSCLQNNEYILLDLLPDKAYKLRIQASNGVGDSPSSSSTTFTTSLVPPPGPSLELVNATSSGLKLRWSPATSSNISIDEVCIQMREASGLFQDTYRGNAKSYKCNKLASEEVFEFRCCGTNAAGTGPYGPPQFAKTLAAPIPAPQGIVFNDNDNDIEVMWDVDDYSILTDDMIFELQGRLVNASARDSRTVIVASVDGIVSTVNLTKGFEVIYSGFDNLVNLCGLSVGLNLEVRFRVVVPPKKGTGPCLQSPFSSPFIFEVNDLAADHESDEPSKGQINGGKPDSLSSKEAGMTSSPKEGILAQIATPIRQLLSETLGVPSNYVHNDELIVYAMAACIILILAILIAL